MKNRRVAITGIGPVTAFGIGIDPLWDAMVEGRTAIRKLDPFVEAGMPCPFAAQLEADAFDVRKIVPKSYRKATKVMCRDIQLAVVGAAAAVADAGLVTKGTDADAEPSVPAHRLGCHIGAGLISADVNELSAALVTSKAGENGHATVDLNHWGHTGMTNLTPLWLLKYLPNMLACHVTIIHDCRGPSNTITCCEASSALSLGESMRVIARDAADVCLTGGAEYKLNPFAFLRQHFADRLADVDAEATAETIVRPFDPHARGSVVGEGGGIVVLEAVEHARTRDARIYAEIAGFAATQSACADTAGLRADDQDPSLADAIEIALASAGAKPDEVDAIAPFASSIPHVDGPEAAAIRSVFGDRASTLPLITVTPNVGNCAAGHGAVTLAVAARAMAEGRLPARLNTSGAEGLDADACASRDAELNTVLVMTPSQGGHNAAFVLKRLEA